MTTEDDKEIDNLWNEREELLKAEEYKGDDELECTCHLDIDVACPIHTEEKELEG